MKKINNLLLGLFVCAFLCTAVTFGQEPAADEYKPMYLVITTMHWSSDSDTDFSDWEKTEKEYFDKVTSKNDLIVGSGIYTHYFTPDNSEIISVTAYRSWSDIEKANDKDNELIEAGWPDEDTRKAFFEKQSSYYDAKHSDEIYTTFPLTKELKTDSKEPLLFYVRRNTASGEGGGYKEFFDNVTMKNQYIKGFYTHGHRWGKDARDRVEVGVYESLGDIEKAFDENQRLIETHWPDEEKRKEFFKEFSKIFSGHGDYIYQNVPELSK